MCSDVVYPNVLTFIPPLRTVVHLGVLIKLQINLEKDTIMMYFG
jgi:hypothetical protein